MVIQTFGQLTHAFTKIAIQHGLGRRLPASQPWRKTGASMTTGWQIHALGNRNYNTQLYPNSKFYNCTNTTWVNADYAQAFECITIMETLSSCVKLRSSDAIDIFNTSVFSARLVGIKKKKLNDKISISPNPSSEKYRFANLKNNRMENHIVNSI